jgi:hypothetical protein
MDSKQFFAEVQAELDARRDPLDRADLVDWLEQNSDALEDFADLRAIHYRLTQVSQAPIRRWPVWVSLAAAAALLIFISMPPKQTVQPQPADVAARLDTEETAPLARVISVKHSTSEKQTTITPTRSVQSSGASILSLSMTTRSVVVHSRP